MTTDIGYVLAAALGAIALAFILARLLFKPIPRDPDEDEVFQALDRGRCYLSDECALDVRWVWGPLGAPMLRVTHNGVAREFREIVRIEPYDYDFREIGRFLMEGHGR